MNKSRKERLNTDNVEQMQTDGYHAFEDYE